MSSPTIFRAAIPTDPLTTAKLSIHNWPSTIKDIATNQANLLAEAGFNYAIPIPDDDEAERLVAAVDNDKRYRDASSRKRTLRKSSEGKNPNSSIDGFHGLDRKQIEKRTLPIHDTNLFWTRVWQCIYVRP